MVTEMDEQMAQQEFFQYHSGTNASHMWEFIENMDLFSEYAEYHEKAYIAWIKARKIKVT
jgi:hypothetical protein